MSGFLLAAFSFLIVLGPLILIHELGHFIAARLVGITVLEFGIGFPPRAVTLFEQGGTKFTLNWLPIGGFVRPLGEDFVKPIGEEATDQERKAFEEHQAELETVGKAAVKPKSLMEASPLQRIFFMVAGALMNFVGAFVLLTIASMVGHPVVESSTVNVQAISPDSPAAAVLMAGDHILKADDLAITSSNMLVDYIKTHAGEKVVLIYERAGQQGTADIVPRKNPPAGQGALGVQVEQINPVVKTERASFGEAIGLAWDQFSALMVQVAGAPIEILRGTLSPQEARPVSAVGIAQMSGQVVQKSIDTREAYPILGFAAVISIALGITNLLPIPALDGGRILFVLIEILRGKPLPPEREGMVHLVGLVILLGLSAVLIVNDLINPINLSGLR
ncbi:MAG: M50 family metallopeptidase [Chloroflexota bacterium]